MEERTSARDPSLRTSNGHFRTILRQRAEFVQRFPLFLEVTVEDCEKIAAIAQERNFSRGKTIFFQGDHVQQVLLLTSGCVKLSQYGSDGQEVILRLVGPGETINAEGCTKCAVQCSTARSLEQSSALVWDAKQFEVVAENCPALRRNISHYQQEIMNQLEDRYREVCTQKVAPRLSSELLRLLERVGKETNGYVEIALSRRDLAQLTGTTLFTVSRLLCQWELLGIVRPRREAVQILNIPALVELARAE